ncbi:MAG: ureidoglycolate lyase [Actinobacteria bacterium]|nr:ureidoglycolate lyase [Actinomycetota bacterium]
MKTLELNANNFKEFGNIIEVDDKFCLASMDNFKYYLIDSMKSDCEVTIGLLEAFKKVEGIKQLERHHLTEEVILPIKGKALLHLAGPDKSSLAMDDILTFEIEPGTGVKLYKDVWHAIPVIESEELFLCLILKTKTSEEDLYFTEPH